MALRLEIVSENRSLVGDDAVHEFSEDGGSIGRSLNSDWILPDPDKYVSSRHAIIDYKAGSYYIVDVSTNGVYVNSDREPVGKGNPRRLYSGDRLRLGDFEIAVQVDAGESIERALEEDDGALSDPIELSVPEVSLKSGVQLLDEEELTGDNEFRAALFGDEDPLPQSSIPAPPPTEHEPVPMPARAGQAGDDLLDAFLDGLGVSRTDLHPTTDPADVMKNAGEVLREFVEGMAKLLVSRANLKTAFRLDQTTVLPRHNNPLKLSQNPANAIRQLLVGGEGEYVGPRDAVREVCRDLLHHQDAFLDAMSAAFVEFADRFDPDELEAGFASNPGSTALFGFLARNRFWDAYRDIYPSLTEKGRGRFPHMFAEEFVKAYERQIAEFKRVQPLQTNAPKLEPLSEEEYERSLAETQDELDEDLIEELKRTIDGELDEPESGADTDTDADDYEDEFGEELRKTIDEELAEALAKDGDVSANDDDQPDETDRASG